MNRTTFLVALWSLLAAGRGLCQGGPPWNNPLKMAWSTDGMTFNPPATFQDSAGVPSVIRWKGDTLIAAFQWFRQPQPSPTWDRVATKLSYDNGLTWTQPTPIVVNGLPSNYQRPFDPTLTVIGGDSLRVYFSSSDGMPQGGLDSTVNTYSARSADGVHFDFEAGPRVDELHNRVIDPAVIYFNTGWHYLSPIGSPQQGAYHYVSPNGLNFNPVPNIPSDNQHNWTGNYMVESSTELRFYGSGQNIWYNYSPNGGQWLGYVNTNIQGGDPSVVKVSANNYLMVYVGQPYTTGISDEPLEEAMEVYPNPSGGMVTVRFAGQYIGSIYVVSDAMGHAVRVGAVDGEETRMDLGDLPRGIYFVRLEGVSGQARMILRQ